MVVAQFGQCCTRVLQRITTCKLGPTGCYTMWAVLITGARVLQRITMCGSVQVGSEWLMHNVASAARGCCGVLQCAGRVRVVVA